MPKKIKNFQDVLAHLDSLGLFHMDLRLDRMRRALEALRLTSPPFVTAQILGTNGKGSTAAFLASLCAAHGCRVGLYISPHFVSPAERILIDGRSWPEKHWADAANVILQLGEDLTYFEFMTLLALLAFCQASVDVAILEAGLGGRHDATTAIPADVLCYTPIAMDHANVLGPTLKDIAADKAAAVRGNAPVCTAPQFPVAARGIADAAAAHRAPVIAAAPLPTGFTPGLNGPHQKLNASLALTAWRQLAPLLGKDAHDDDAQAQGLSRAFLPGRFQQIPASGGHPPLLLDGAHNPHGMRALIGALREADIRPACAVFSCLSDKDWQPAAMTLKRFLGASPAFIPPLRTERAASPADVAAVWNRTPPRTARPAGDLEAALAAAGKAAGAQTSADRPVLLTGSLYLLAEFFTLHAKLMRKSL
jgi:dihydrofolate synthase/folylpolyglutamate synthase